MIFQRHFLSSRADGSFHTPFQIFLSSYIHVSSWCYRFPALDDINLWDLIDTIYITQLSSKSGKIARCNHGKMSMNWRHENWSRSTGLGFYRKILFIQPIRQFDNPFIPLSFHWNGHYLKRRSVNNAHNHNCQIHWFCNNLVLFLDEKSSHILSTWLFQEVLKQARKLELGNFYAHLQWKTEGC